MVYVIFYPKFLKILITYKNTDQDLVTKWIQMGKKGGGRGKELEG